MGGLGKWLLGSFVLLTSWANVATTVDTAEVTRVALDTNKGQIVLELASDEAPVTVTNFLDYVENGFYNGLVFHRVINDFMIQGGGFTQDMNQRVTQAPIKNESLLHHRLENRRGSIAMARTQIVDSATAQFFINLKDNDALNGQSYKPGYAVFGHVIKGMDVVDSIGRVKTGYRGRYGDVPVEPVTIEKAYIIEVDIIKKAS